MKENVASADSRKHKTKSDSFSALAVLARRALGNSGINSVKQLTKFSEAEISKLHGMRPNSMPKLRSASKVAGLSFKK